MKESVISNASKETIQERLKLRLKTIEDGLKGQNTTKTEKTGKILGFLTSGGGSKKRSTSQPRGSVTGRIYALNHRVAESDEKENSKITSNGLIDQHEEDGKRKAEEDGNVDSDDMVSGFLYDRLQKEVIALRKICDSKDGTINAKNEEIKVTASSCSCSSISTIYKKPLLT